MTLAELAEAYKAGPREDGRTLSPMMLDNDHVAAYVHDEDWMRVDTVYEAHPAAPVGDHPLRRPGRPGENPVRAEARRASLLFRLAVRELQIMLPGVAAGAELSPACPGAQTRGDQVDCRSMTADLAGIRVHEGEVLLSAVDVLSWTAEKLVLEIDCRSKYPEVAYQGSTVMLYGGERTLRTDPDADGHTIIELPAGIRDWQVVAEASRYTVRIVAWKQGRRRTEIWRYR
jgi:hypothetical protein